MSQHRSPVMPQSFSALPSRRDVLRGLSGAGFGLAAARLPGAAAKKKRKHKHKHRKRTRQAEPNAFGCLNVGDPCTSVEQCCSGICGGKKDKKTCRAHHAGTCRQGEPGICTAPDPSLSACNSSTTCACFRTTAGSSICAELFAQDLTDCAECQRDADCEALGFPPGTACAPVSEGECALLCASGMACLVPCGVELPEP